MEFVGSALTELCITDEGSRRGRMGRRRHNDDDTTVFKSKNLQAERRRRQKLSDRLLSLRAIVPIITNMNKATIIEDAITYIQQLQMNVQDLSDQLLDMESSTEDAAKPRTDTDEIDTAEEMKQCGIKEDVKVTNIDENRIWIKIIFEKKRGRFTKLMEAMTYLGYELADTTVTTSKGAVLVSSCVEGTYGDTLAVQQTRDLLLEIIKSI